MFFNKEYQFISILNSPNRLKVYIQILNGKQIFSNENSPFKIYDNEIMPQEICNFLNRKQEKIPLTYISTIVNSTDQQIVENSFKYDKEEYIQSHLTNNNIIIIPKSTLFEVNHFFECSGIDLIYSPFHILLRYIEKKNTHPSLDILICDNIIYALICDDEQILFSASRSIISFEEIQESHFFDTPEEQKELFEQLYILELSNILKDFLDEFNNSSNAKFIEKINILYIVEKLQQVHIEQISQDLLMDINYYKIAFLEELNELAKDDIL